MEQSFTLSLRIEPDKIGLLKFLIEGYDNLAILSTVEPTLGFVVVRTTWHQAPDLLDVLAALQKEYYLRAPLNWNLH